jgi:hypothetical protein
MAASDSSRVGDLLPWWLLGLQANAGPTTPQLEERDGCASTENLGGPLPWGCDQPGPGLQPQA